MSNEYRFFTLASLGQVKINGAKSGARRRTLIAAAKDAGADEKTLFPVVETLLHNDSEYRLNVALGVKDGKAIGAIFDIPLTEYRKLPKINADAES